MSDDKYKYIKQCDDETKRDVEVRLNRFLGEKRLFIRKWRKSKDNQWWPTDREIIIKQDEIMMLAKAIHNACSLVGATDHKLPRSRDIEIRISSYDFNQQINLSIRLWNRSFDGEWMPMKKGVTLNEKETTYLVKSINEIIKNQELVSPAITDNH